MDTLYVGDIPKDYHYALFNNGYIDLYNTDRLHNDTYTFYRVYTNAGGFYYRTYEQTYSQYNTTYAQDINVTDNKCYRQDFPSILFMTICFALIGIWLFNLITSLIRKGGLLGGLF